MKVLITGANGQLGRALSTSFPDSIGVDSNVLDITDRDQVLRFDLNGIGAIINAAAYTAVDKAEDPTNQELVERVNVSGVANLAELATKAYIPLVHVSTDYVFDGTKEDPYTEENIPNGKGFYGTSKARGDLEAAKVPKHYIFRTSMVMGDGANFVKAILNRANNELPSGVVSDQFGRITFTDTLAEAIKFALENEIPFGIYNLTNSGNVVSWYEVAKAIYELSGKDPSLVSPISTEEYFKDFDFAAPRPANSTLDLKKIESAGFTPEDWQVKLKEYLEDLKKKE
jgi:dTDP-4-dehydrorhamnose reductase